MGAPDTPVATGPWSALLDDASALPPAELPLHEVTAAHSELTAGPHGDVVGALVLRDTDLPLVRGTTARLAIVCTGGAGQVSGPLGLARRLGLDVAGVVVGLADPGDLAANARRVVAAVDVARDDELLPATATVHVALPPMPVSAGWAAAADVLAAAGFGLGLALDKGPAGPADPATVAGWIDCALDREMAFRCTGGLQHAVRHRDRATGAEHHGLLNVLLATQTAWDGGTVAEVAELLDDHYPNDLVALARSGGLANARRWFTAYAASPVGEPLEELRGLGVLPER